MQGSNDSLNVLWGKLKQKSKSSDTDAACILLANKLYCDYIDAFKKSTAVEAERFADEWIKKNVPSNYRTMKKSIWRNFLCRLIEHRCGKR